MRKRQPYKLFDELRSLIERSEKEFIYQEAKRDNKKQKQIAKEAEITKGRVSQIILKYLEKIKSSKKV
jgi:DNA-directed RNA polymerase specialized sigma subunit